MKGRTILFLGIVFSMVSCRTIQQITVRKDVPLTTENRLLKNIEDHKPEYTTLFAKRIDGSLRNEKEKSSFKASLKIHRDNFIQISVTAPLGIEVARILLTPDSVKIVDTYHKKYFLSDYDYFCDLLEMKVNFDYVQDILTNTFVHFDFSSVPGTRRYKMDRLDEGYELSTIEEKALGRRLKKLYKKRRPNKNVMLIQQKTLVDASCFRPLHFSLEDVEEGIGVRVGYEGFKDFSGKYFPTKILFELFDGERRTHLDLQFQKIEFDVPVESNIRILPKYKKMELNMNGD